jgi:sigma-B regulation protein RsbU (phosphoserine phosphatase)
MSNQNRRNKEYFLRTIFYSLSDGVVIADSEGRPMLLNPSAERMLGVSGKNLDPTKWTTVCGCYLPDKITPYPPDRMPLARAARGQEILDELIFVRNSQRPSGGWISVDARPVMDNTGSICGGVGVFRDISGRENAEQKIKLMERLSRALEQTADSVVITDMRGHIEYVNQAFETTSGFSRSDVLGRTPRILKSGRHDEEFYRRLWGEIKAGRAFRGTVVNKKKSGELYWAEQTITPVKDDAGNITHFVSVLKDITELLQKKEREVEMRLAREVQQQYYKAAASVPGFDIAGVACPADETGGDYFDFINMPDGCLCVVIGDVSGHGISSALVMAELRAYLRSFATTCSDVGKILTQTNRALEVDLEEGRFVTLLLICLDPKTRVMTYASAGHEPGYLLGSSGDIDFVFEATGPPLGIFPDTSFPSGKAQRMESGQLVLLLTDGVFDSLAGDDTKFLADGAIEYVNAHRHEHARQIAEGLCEKCKSHAGNQFPKDDVTSVILKTE